MSEGRIACERTFTLADEQKTPVFVQWEVPTEGDRCWGCTFSIRLDGKELHRKRIFGADGVQALQLAMSTAATELLLLRPPVYLHEPDDGLGLPVLESVKDLADEREARRGVRMDEPEVIVRVEGFAGRITLNRPRALNALNANMCAAICDALLAWKDDDQIGSVVIDGSGERAFCAGGDIRVVAESGKTDGVEARRFFHTEYRMNELLQRYPKPVVAIMDGITMGGGVGISAPCAIRIATERTLWAMPEGDIGLFPDVGGGWHLSRLPRHAGVWLALTGARLKGADCVELGIATHFLPSQRIEELKTLLTSAHPGEGRDPGQVVSGFAAGGGASATADSGNPTASLVPGPGLRRDEREWGDVDRLFAFDTVEEIVAAVKADGSEWADALSKKCPTTLKVALRLIREGARRASFAEEMAVEYRLAVRMTRRHDFIDGVRAVIVDKDNSPRWDPPTLEGVSGAMLDELFSPLPADEEWTPLP